MLVWLYSSRYLPDLKIRPPYITQLHSSRLAPRWEDSLEFIAAEPARETSEFSAGVQESILADVFRVCTNMGCAPGKAVGGLPTRLAVANAEGNLLPIVAKDRNCYSQFFVASRSCVS